jgi:hypothetical protein
MRRASAIAVVVIAAVAGCGGDGNGGGAGTGAGTGAGAGAGTGDAGGGDLDAGSDAGSVGSREIAAAPTYLGTVDNGAECGREYATYGYEPDGDADERHPLFLYFSGTNFITDPETFRSDAAHAARAVTEAMARRGFVALAVEYDNSAVAWLSDHMNQLRCLFGVGEDGSVLARACALPNVDCDLGIAAWGHSQGGYIAHAAANLDARVRAVWTAGYGGNDQAVLPRDRLRVVNGEHDVTNAVVATLNHITGLSDAECPDDGRKQCLRDDGSGWIIVQAADCQVSTADHCWFDKVSCTDATVMLEPNWIDPGSEKPFALEPNADWVARTLARP